MSDLYRQRQLFVKTPGLVRTKTEDQWFDRKSIRVQPNELARHMIGFANADGGTIIVGIEDDKRVTGVDEHTTEVNALRQAALNHSEPPVRHTVDLVECRNEREESNHLLVFEIHPSDAFHRDTKGGVHLRVGDQTRRLSAEQAQELAYDKGWGSFDGTVVPGITMADLDDVAMSAFVDSLALPGSERQVLRARSLLTTPADQVTSAAVLLFGRVPQEYLPNAYVRILRYDGVVPTTGTRSNVIFDRRIEGTIPYQIRQAEQVMLNQLRYFTRLDERSGRFVTIPEVPRFAWLEAIVNAVTHRSYSYQGDYIRVSIFDDRVVIESPGRLPGHVQIDNIRETRFSRNPRIARVLSDVGDVRELNEGMKRIYEEMSRAGLPEPRLKQTESGFVVTLFNRPDNERLFVERLRAVVPDEAFLPALDRLLSAGQLTTTEAASLTGLSAPSVRRRLRALAEEKLVERVGASLSDPTSFWRLTIELRARWKLAS